MATGCDTTISLLADADIVATLGDTGSTGNWGKIFDVANAVASRMNAECGRTLKASTYSEVYDGNGTNSLLLRNYPLASTAITVTIAVDRDYSTGTTDYQVTGTDIMLDTDMGRVRLYGWTFGYGAQSVKVSYTAGFSSSGPAWDLIDAARDYLQIAWNRRSKRDIIGLRSESFEGGSRTYENDLPWSVRKVLDMYRDRRVS